MEIVYYARDVIYLNDKYRVISGFHESKGVKSG